VALHGGDAARGSGRDDGGPVFSRLFRHACLPARNARPPERPDRERQFGGLEAHLAGAAGYASARWALRGFTEALRQDLAGSGVGVTHFVVGKVSSAYFAHNPGTEARIPTIARLIGR